MKYMISARDLAVTRGTAAFMVCRFRRHNNALIGLHFDNHYERLVLSCEAAGIYAARNALDIVDLPWKILMHWPNDDLVDGVVRLIVTGGESPDSVNSVQGEERIIISIDPYKPPLSQPLTLQLVRGKHQVPHVKITGKYAIPKMYRDEARRKGYDDILFWHDNDFITESFSANFFVIFDNTLFTPKMDVLHGVTRKIALALAKQSGLFEDVVEVAYCVPHCYDQSAEAFLTSTTRGIMPVVKISEGVGLRSWAFKTGHDTKTAKLQELYNEYVERYFFHGK